MLKRLLIPLICLLVGATIGWYVRGQKSETEFRTLVLLHAIEKAGIAANMNRVVDENRLDALDTLIGWELNSGISSASQMVDEGAALPTVSGFANLRDGMARARAAAEARGKPELVKRADNVLKNL